MIRFALFQARHALLQLAWLVLSVARTHWQVLRWLARHAGKAFGVCSWALAARWAPRRVSGLDQRCCVVLLSYKRVANLDLIVRACLGCDFVGKVVVSNNNAETRIAEWVRVRDPRPTLIDQAAATRQGVRLELALAQDFEYFVTFDDDRFLLPSQIEALFRHLLADPSVPHGVEGETRVEPDAAKGRLIGYPFKAGVSHAERTVDTLTGVYFFTRRQLARCVELLDHLGIADLRAFGNGEDIVISRSGDGDPCIHDVGALRECYTSHVGEIATWTNRGFFAERLDLRRRLRSAPARPVDPPLARSPLDSGAISRGR